MRTTLTLDPDVARMVKEEVHRRQTTLKSVVNEAIRESLSGPGKDAVKQKRYRVVPHKTRLLPGLDRNGFNRLVDQLDDDAIVDRFEPHR